MTCDEPSEPTEQTLQNCMEISGIVQMFMVDAESPMDRMTLGNALLIAAIGSYRKAKMSFEEIDDVLVGALKKYKQARDQM